MRGKGKLLHTIEIEFSPWMLFTYLWLGISMGPNILADPVTPQLIDWFTRSKIYETALACKCAMTWSLAHQAYIWPFLSDSLTHWGRMTHSSVGNLTIIGSDNGLSPGRRQAIIWTNAEILLFGPSGTNLSEIAIAILTCSFTKMRVKVSSAKWRPYCFSFNVLIFWGAVTPQLLDRFAPS